MDKYPTRALTVGASEQMMLSIAVGLADSGKIPFVYSITPFLLYRPFEVIRNYIDHEKCNVKLIGCGRNSDYAHDGFTHYAGDDRAIMDNFTNITKIWPENLLELEEALTSTYKSSDPCYINITR
jgi:transketolase